MDLIKLVRRAINALSRAWRAVELRRASPAERLRLSPLHAGHYLVMMALNHAAYLPGGEKHDDVMNAFDYAENDTEAPNDVRDSLVEALEHLDRALDEHEHVEVANADQ